VIVLKFDDAFLEFKTINSELFNQSEAEMLEELMGAVHYDPSVKYLSGLLPKERKKVDDKLTALMKKYSGIYPAGSCGNMHNLHLEEIGNIFPRCINLYLTIGLLLDNGRNIYCVPPKDQCESVFGAGSELPLRKRSGLPRNSQLMSGY
jgi:hypothetical protein